MNVILDFLTCREEHKLRVFEGAEDVTGTKENVILRSLHISCVSPNATEATK
jgi:hypothetical protein